MAADNERTPEDSESSSINKSQPSLSGETARNPSLDQVAKPMHDGSPLLSLVGTNEEADDLAAEITQLDDHHDKFEDAKSIWYLILLTISIGGLQLAWAVELSNGTPYLLSLGLSKSLMALVWIAGPLSGALVQPYVGMLSDNCRSPWGKRRPFMAIGSTATIVSLMVLAWVREMVGGFLGVFGADRESAGVKNTIIVVAVIFVYILDFSINTVQAAIRAFILDCCPSHQQEAANSMASRALGIGNILGFLSGYINLRKHLSFFGNTQFKVLCVVASVALASTVTLSSSTIQERDPRHEPPASKRKGGLISFFKQVFSSIQRLPPQTRKVCEVEFFAWIGFFPQLFYSSSYIGDIYVQSSLEEDPNMSPDELDHLYEKATRIGTFALLMYAIVSLSTNVLLPFAVAPTYDAQSSAVSVHSQKSYTTRFSRLLDSLVIPWLTLRRAWLIAHLIFVACMFSTLFVRSVEELLSSLLCTEVSKRDALRRLRTTTNDAEDEVDQAGIILGIHNMSVASPQILATLGSSLAFKSIQKPRGTPGDHSFSYILAAGGISTLVATWLTSKIRDEVPLTEEGVLENGNGHANGNGHGNGVNGHSGENGGVRGSGERRRCEEGADDGRNSLAVEPRPVIRSSSFSGLEY